MYVLNILLNWPPYRMFRSSHPTLTDSRSIHATRVDFQTSSLSLRTCNLFVPNPSRGVESSRVESRAYLSKKSSLLYEICGDTCPHPYVSGQSKSPTDASIIHTLPGVVPKTKVVVVKQRRKEDWRRSRVVNPKSGSNQSIDDFGSATLHT